MRPVDGVEAYQLTRSRLAARRTWGASNAKIDPGEDGLLEHQPLFDHQTRQRLLESV